jgi:cholesterol transport system auxiliary component
MFRIWDSRRRVAKGSGRTAVPRTGRESAIRHPPSAIARPVLLVILALSAGGLFGCAQSLPQRQYYILEARRPAETPATGSQATLLLRPFRMDVAFVGRSLVYRVSAFRYESDYYHQFLIPPAAMLEEKTRDWLADCGLFAQIVPPGSAVEATYTLSANVTALYGDFSDRSAPQAVLDIHFTLLGAPGPDQPTLLAKSYRAASPIAERTADAVIAALNQDLVQILSQLEADLRQHLAEPARPGS